MKVNSTVALTLILLSLMVGAGGVSAAWGYAMGREALKGVTQPDVRPTAGNAEEPRSNQPREFEIIPEAQILEDVKTQMDGATSYLAPVDPNATAPSATDPSAMDPQLAALANGEHWLLATPNSIT